MKPHKALIVGGELYKSYANPFLTMDNVTITYNERELPGCSFVVFCGGSDVSPHLYQDTLVPGTMCSPGRDKKEARIYRRCAKLKIPMVGICRGSQFLTVMNGGKLIQDVSDHGVWHDILDLNTSRIIKVSSTHHQMMNPFEMPNDDYRLLAVSAPNRSKKYITGERTSSSKFRSYLMEPEVVWYPRTQSLAVQYHPEMMTPDQSGWTYFQDLVRGYVLYAKDR